jgi:hypothetical protein
MAAPQCVKCFFRLTASLILCSEVIPDQWISWAHRKQLDEDLASLQTPSCAVESLDLSSHFKLLLGIGDSIFVQGIFRQHSCWRFPLPHGHRCWFFLLITFIKPFLANSSQRPKVSAMTIA